MEWRATRPQRLNLSFNEYRLFEIASKIAPNKPNNSSAIAENDKRILFVLIFLQQFLTY